MEHSIGPYEFLGDFKYFNIYIIPILENIFRREPNLVIALYTYDDYAKILREIFPKNINIIEAIALDSTRTKFTNTNVELLRYRSLIEYFKQYDKYKMYLDGAIDISLNKVISLSDSNECELIQDKNIICIYTYDFKLFGIEKWNKIFEYVIKRYPDHKIINLGNNLEKVKFNNENIINCDNIIETIKYLNICDLLISVNSGFIEFAKNCMTKNILVITGTEKVEQYNPFSINIIPLNGNKIEDILVKIKSVVKSTIPLVKYLYDGDLRSFMVSILPYVDKLLNEDEDATFELETYPDICNLIEKMYPNRIMTNQILSVNTGVGLSVSNPLCSDHIYNFILNKYKKVQRLNGTNIDTYISAPIKSDPNTDLENRNFCLIYPKASGMPYEIADYFIHNIKKNSPNMDIILIGNKNEILELENYQVIQNFMECVNYFKYCKFFITVDDGIKDLALNCSCKNILMYTTRDRSSTQKIDEYNTKYNPFNSDIKIVESKKIFSSDIEKYIKQKIKQSTKQIIDNIEDEDVQDETNEDVNIETNEDMEESEADVQDDESDTEANMVRQKNSIKRKPLKIALIMRGLADCKEYMHPHSRKTYSVDYMKSIPNYKANLYEHHDVDVFFHTYETESLKYHELVECLDPKAYEVTPPGVGINTFSVHPKTASLLNSMSRALDVYLKYQNENKTKYDYVILTRFDLLFKIKLSELGLEKDKFMISCMCKQSNQCDDNFFVMNPNDVVTFKKCIDTYDKNKLYIHEIYPVLVNTFKDRLKILIDGNYLISRGTPLFDIVRSNTEDIMLDDRPQQIYITTKYLPKFVRFAKSMIFYNKIKTDLDFAMIDYDMQLLRELQNKEAKKISIFLQKKIRINENELIDSNYTVAMKTTDGDVVNIILQHRRAVDDVTFVIHGKYNENVRFIRNLYSIYGKVIQSTWAELSLPTVENFIREKNIDNTDNCYLHAYSTLKGIEKVTTKYCIKVRSDEFYVKMNEFIGKIKNDPTKLVTNDVSFKKTMNMPYHISDHLIGGLKTNMLDMFSNTIKCLEKRYDFTNIFKYLKPSPLKTAKQKLVFSYLLLRNESITGNIFEINKTMKKYFDIVPTSKLGSYGVCSNKVKSGYIHDIYCGKYSYLTPEVISINDL
jgi:hypothetical protein